MRELLLLGDLNGVCNVVIEREIVRSVVRTFFRKIIIKDEIQVYHA